MRLMYTFVSWGSNLPTIAAILLDLDDTLLCNDMRTFVPRYMEALLAHMQPLCSTSSLIEGLRSGTRAMLGNDGSGATNEELFWDVFTACVHIDRPTLECAFAEFYETAFEDLGSLTERDAEAPALVDAAFERGFRVAIATQPIFPRVAVEARLRWAGVGPETYPYHLISSYERMRACKPHPRFFLDVSSALGCTLEECLMVGDDVDADMGASAYGLKTFWVRRARSGRHGDARGSLDDLRRLIDKGGIDDL